MLYTCPCCGYKTFGSEPPGTFEICDICFWEDDNIQFHNPFYKGGANHISLKQAQENYRNIGVSKEDMKRYVRTPNANDIFDSPKDISKYIQVNLKDFIKLFKTLNIDVSLVLDAYYGHKVEKKTNFRFNNNYDLDDLLSFETQLMFRELIHIEVLRKQPNSIFNKSILKLSQTQIEIDIENIRKEFRNKVNLLFNEF